MIIVICQGHSGSRLLSQCLQRSGIWMGKRINSSGDIVPKDWPQSEPPLYEAARHVNRYVRPTSFAEWDFSPLLSMPPTDAWWAATHDAIHTVLYSPEPRGWKLPETLFSLPWLTTRFPDARYVRWVRDPRAIIAGRRAVDRYQRVGLPHGGHGNTYVHRAIAYKYQFDLVATTPKPTNWQVIRYEDFVLDQANTLRRLSAYVERDLKPVPVDPTRVHYDIYDQYPSEATDLLRGGLEAWY